MNRKTYETLTNDLYTRATEVSKSKSKDYATEDVLSNFKRISSIVKTLDLRLDTPANYALCMVILKIDRIVNLLKQGGVAQNEPIDDSFMDAINYLLLAYAGYKEPTPAVIYEYETPYSATSGSPMTIIGDDGDLEWVCEHGVGHSKGVHTCDGKECCDKALKQLKKTKKK